MKHTAAAVKSILIVEHASGGIVNYQRESVVIPISTIADVLNEKSLHVLTMKSTRWTILNINAVRFWGIELNRSGPWGGGLPS